MDEYREIRDRRVEQFAKYLQLMRKRQRGLTSGPCFIIFAELTSGQNTDVPALRKSCAAMPQAAISLGRRGDFGDRLNDPIAGEFDSPLEEWRDDDSNRFVQFGFNPDHFEIDLPNTTLWPAEAAEILQRRRGFFYVKDRRQFEHPEEKVSVFNPLRRANVYGDEGTAAEDMAFVWFDVWKFPVDWRFYVTAAVFCEATKWEKDRPLDVDSVVPED